MLILVSKRIAINQRIDSSLDELVAITGLSKQLVLEKAVEAFLREQFLRKTNEEFAAIKAKPELWELEVQERTDWDSTLSDGLDDDSRS